jgi:hypothetical protein
LRIALLVLRWSTIRLLVSRRVSPRREEAAPARVAWALRVCERWLPWVTCLSQALAAQWLLALSGHAAEVQIGAYRDEDGVMRFHAAVLCGEQAIYGEREMATLLRLGSSPQ